jgi:hypothetical protein
MRGENFMAHLDGLGVTPVAHHWNNSMLVTGDTVVAVKRIQ